MADEKRNYVKMVRAVGMYRLEDRINDFLTECANNNAEIISIQIHESILYYTAIITIKTLWRSWRDWRVKK